MLKDKFNRHSIAFLTFSAASALLYIAIRGGANLILWVLLGSILLAAILTLFTK